MTSPQKPAEHALFLRQLRLFLEEICCEICRFQFVGHHDLDAEGVQIFIGAENALFAHAGCSVIVSPYKNRQEHVIGAIGVIGPLRMNYARIIPMVDYTARVIGKLVR